MNKLVPTTLLLAMAAVAGAQQRPAKTFDGAVVVDGRPQQQGSERAGSAPPLVVVSGSRVDPTTWNPADTGQVVIKGVNSGVSQSVLVNPGAAAKLSGSGAGQPATVVRTGANKRVVKYTSACPAFHSGTITWDQEEIRTVNDPNWKPIGPKMNLVDTCTPIEEFRWVAEAQACPAYYNGSITWQAEERRIGGGPWARTGRTQNRVESCTPVVETRWVPASQGCPAYYTGSITWQAEEQRVGGGAWTPTGRTQNRVDSCTGIVETRWVGASAGCPAGYAGSNTWEAEERRTAGGPWYATGATRNASNTCAPVAKPCNASTRTDLRSFQSLNPYPWTDLRVCDASNQGQKAVSFIVSCGGAGCGGGLFRAMVCQGGGWAVVAGVGSTPYNGALPGDYAPVQTQGYNDYNEIGWGGYVSRSVTSYQCN